MTTSNLLGVGLYRPSAVAKMASVEPARVNRWIRGYSFKGRAGDKRRSEPFLRADLPEIEGKRALSFYDLVDVLFVKAFSERGVSIQTIRKAVLRAAQEFDHKHPFCLRRFRTDGRTIFAQFGDEPDGDRLMDLVQGQFAFEKVIRPYLQHIEYDFDIAARWWPLGKRRTVLLDPHRSFGAPIVQRGVPTAALYGNYQAEGGNLVKVAKWFDVTAKEVEDAVEFEQRLAA